MRHHFFSRSRHNLFYLLRYEYNNNLTFCFQEAKLISSNMNTPNSVRGSVMSEASANDIPLDSISQVRATKLLLLNVRGILLQLIKVFKEFGAS